MSNTDESQAEQLQIAKPEEPNYGSIEDSAASEPENTDFQKILARARNNIFWCVFLHLGLLNEILKIAKNNKFVFSTV